MTYSPTDYSYYSTGSAQKGSSRFFEGPRPGECEVEVEYESRKYFYKIQRGMRSGFRRWVKSTWSNMNGTPRVSGAWPRYDVEWR